MIAGFVPAIKREGRVAYRALCALMLRVRNTLGGRRALAVILWAVLVLLVTLSPFQFGAPGLEVREGGRGVWWWPGVGFALNLIMFVPLGYALGRAARRRGATIVMAALAVSLSIEVAQVFLPGRHASAMDVLANTLGAYLGFRLSRRPLPAAGSHTWLALMGLWAVANLVVVHANDDLGLEGWDPRFMLRVGDEITGGRAYRGAILGARLCVGRPPGEDCMELSEDVLGPAPGWAARAEATGALRLEVVATPDDSLQVGPARLVTWSRDASERNVTLGQVGEDAVLRVRTRGSSPNGTWPSVRFPNAFSGVQPGDTVVAVATWLDGWARLEVQSRGWRYEERFARRPADLYGFAESGEFVEPREPGYRDILVMVAVTVPAGLLAAGAVAGLLASASALIAVASTALLLPSLIATPPLLSSWHAWAGALSGALLGWLVGRAVLRAEGRVRTETRR